MVGLDPAPMTTCSAHGGATLSIERSIPAASHRVASELPVLHVPEDFDEPLTDAENAVWEADSADRFDFDACDGWVP
jgi:hypothetical protein